MTLARYLADSIFEINVFILLYNLQANLQLAALLCCLLASN